MDHVDLPGFLLVGHVPGVILQGFVAESFASSAVHPITIVQIALRTFKNDDARPAASVSAMWSGGVL